MAWYRKEKAAVAEALRRGERPDLATTMAIRRLRRHRQRELGSAPAVLYVAGCDARLLLGRGTRHAGCCPAGESAAFLCQAIFP